MPADGRCNSPATGRMPRRNCRAAARKTANHRNKVRFARADRRPIHRKTNRDETREMPVISRRAATAITLPPARVEIAAIAARSNRSNIRARIDRPAKAHALIADRSHPGRRQRGHERCLSSSGRSIGYMVRFIPVNSCKEQIHGQVACENRTGRLQL